MRKAGYAVFDRQDSSVMLHLAMKAFLSSGKAAVPVLTY